MNIPTSTTESKLEAQTLQLEHQSRVSHLVSEMEYPEEKRKATVRKVDMRIPPVLMLLYLLSYMDRANIGNAKIEGMAADLGLSDTQYNVVLSIFFVTYITFEIPSSYVMEKYFTFRPSLFLAILTAGWGVFMTLHGVVHNFGGILAVRLIMGAFEAGFFPCAIAYMNKWYTKFELATRLSVFYVGSALSGAFSGLLAYALAKMDGIGGLEGWRWIFIMEGIVTVIVGVLLYWILADRPDNRPSWLTPDEATYLIDRMTLQNAGQTAAGAAHTLNKSILLTVIRDWQYYAFAFVQWSNTVPTYGLKFTLPQIVKNMGFTSSHAQLLSIPPYIAGAISSIVFSVLSDKFRRRAYFLLIPQTLLVIAYALLTKFAPTSRTHVPVCYFAIVLANIGCYPINPGASSWCSNNTAPSAKQSIGIAYLISLSSVGGIFASYIYVGSEAPGYPTGFGTSLAFAMAGIVAVGVLDAAYTKINKRRERVAEEDVREKYTDEELVEMGDRSPLYRYTL